MFRFSDARRRANGSFNNTPADDGSDGNVLNTWWGLRALDCLARSAEKKHETIEWLRACQLASGGFTHQPQPEIGGVDDVAYTWAALRSLALLGAAPADPAACLKYLHSLWNVDGGFADRPGWTSNPLATYYALDSLAALGKLDQPVPQARQRPQPRLEFPAAPQSFLHSARSARPRKPSRGSSAGPRTEDSPVGSKECQARVAGPRPGNCRRATCGRKVLRCQRRIRHVGQRPRNGHI